MLLDLGADDGDLAHAERGDLLGRAAGAEGAEVGEGEEDAAVGVAYEGHVGEDWGVVAVFEGCPDALLGCGCGCGLGWGWGWGGGGTAGEGGDEACAEEDGEDAEGLGGVWEGGVRVSCAEGVLDF